MHEKILPNEEDRLGCWVVWVTESRPPAGAIHSFCDPLSDVEWVCLNCQRLDRK